MKRNSNKLEENSSSSITATTTKTSSPTIQTNKYYNISSAEQFLKKSTTSNLIPQYSLFNESNNSSNNRPNKVQKTLKLKEKQTTPTPTTLSKYYNYDSYLENKKEKKQEKELILKTTTTTTTTNNNYFLPLIIQKEIIFLLVEIGGFLNARRVSKFWKKVSNGCIERMNIYFTDIHLSASVKHVSEVFLKSLNSEYFHLSTVSFINGAKNSISYSEFYFNNVILPFIENVIRYNKTISSFNIKGFPITRINNKSSQQLSPKYKLYHSTSIPSSPKNSNNLNSSNNSITTTTTTTNAVTIPTSTVNMVGVPKGLYFYLTNNFQLKTLSLKNIGLDSRDKFDFFSSLSTSINETLECLTICDNIGDEGMQLLSLVLVKDILRNLKKLELQKNQFTNQSAFYLNRVLLNSNSLIETLNISNNRFDEQALIIMKEGFKNPNSKLKKLILSNNKFSNMDNIDFGESITDLDLHDTMVGSKQSIKGLSLYLKSNTSLNSLNLSFNHISSTDAIRNLSKSFSINQSLKEIDLSFNRINSNFGLDHLVSALLKNDSIQSLSLQSNQIDNNSATILSQLFNGTNKQYSSLTNLNLCGNKIGVGGFKKLFSNLSKYSKTNLIYNEIIENNSVVPNIVKRRNNNSNKNINSNYKVIKNYNDDDITPQNSDNEENNNTINSLEEEILNNIDNEIQSTTTITTIDSNNNSINGSINNNNYLSIDFSLNSSLDVAKAISLIPKFKTGGDKKSTKRYKLVELKF